MKEIKYYLFMFHVENQYKEFSTEYGYKGKGKKHELVKKKH